MADYPITDDLWIMRPYTITRRFRTSVNLLESGPAYAYSWNALRPSPLLDFTIQYTGLTREQVDTLEQFFSVQQGRFLPFRFRDPDQDIIHTNCRFNQDSLSVEYRSPGNHAVTVQIREFFRP